MNKLTKVAIHAEKQKFRLPKKKEKKALSLFNKKDIENYSGFIGVKLSLGENKALFAIFKMLEARKPTIKEDAFGLSGFSARLRFKSKTEYYEAYGVGKRRTKRGKMEYNAGESKLAMRDLYGLTESNLLYYERTYWKKNEQGKEEKLTDPIAFMGSLIRVVIEGKGLDEEEIMKFRNNSLTPKEFEKLFTYEIDIANILVDQWKNYYMLTPSTLFEDIKKVTAGRQDKYTALFIEWLILQVEMRRRKMKVKKADLGLEIKMHYKNMARTLRMDALIKERKWTEIKKTLQQAYKAAQYLGFISACRFNQDDGIDSWIINPEHFPSFNEARKHWQGTWYKKKKERIKTAWEQEQIEEARAYAAYTA